MRGPEKIKKNQNKLKSQLPLFYLPAKLTPAIRSVVLTFAIKG
jgi:hypothetical protein